MSLLIRKKKVTFKTWYETEFFCTYQFLLIKTNTYNKKTSAEKFSSFPRIANNYFMSQKIPHANICHYVHSFIHIIGNNFGRFVLFKKIWKLRDVKLTTEIISRPGQFLKRISNQWRRAH